MQEWLNWLAWKASIPLKGIGGSNPPLSAKIMNASPEVSGLVSVLWSAASKLACETDDVKQKSARRCRHS